ncbi:unnamed protein product [Durusdinium trenchii]|uniref:Uncharacterized protein n=1 Tax=Durusdinium trenchii TaxID=1381693 RepID=A0ABP0Q2S6_9DINO
MGAIITVPTLCEVVLLLAHHWAQAAVSVPSHQPTDLVLKLRERIVVDERELVAVPRRKRVCSSLAQGPFCGGLADAGAEAVSLHRLIGLVDGVISQQLRRTLPDAFQWDPKRDQTISATLSQLVVKLIGSDSFSSDSTSLQRLGRLTGKSRCFELEVWRLLPSQRFLPESFGKGLPLDADPRWWGIWHVVRCPYPASPARALFFGEVWPRRGPCLRLYGLGVKRSASLSLARPVVLRRLVLGVTDSVARSSSSWGKESFVCGELKGVEKWCRSLEDIAKDARASKMNGAGRGTFYTDVGDSLLMVDHVVFHSVPSEGLLIGSLAVSATQEPDGDAEQLVMLLRRAEPQHSHVAPPGLFEAVLETISANAAVWNANQILEHGLRLSGYASGAERLSTRVKLLAKAATKQMEEMMRPKYHDYLASLDPDTPLLELERRLGEELDRPGSRVKESEEISSLDSLDL